MRKEQALNRNENGIIVNSFCDSFNDYVTEEKIDEYKKRVGIPVASSYQEFLDSLEE